MKTIGEYLSWFESSNKLQKLIADSGVLMVPFYQKPWSAGRKKIHSANVKRANIFWASTQGTQFKVLLETELGYKHSNAETGSIKDALALYFSKHFPKKEDNSNV